jgi:long-chain acyl-CoA synthetase
MNKDIANFFWDIGVPVFDCYGLTETSPAVTMNSFSAHKVGTVGKTLENVKVVIDGSVVEEGSDDGEIVVFGPNVMQGYHNQPDATTEVMTEDGGFRTGDRGRLDEDGYLCITGRIKEQYKLENGKYVFPAALEEDIKLIRYVENAMVFGDGKDYNVCLVVPDFLVLEKHAREHNLPAEREELVAREEIHELIITEIQETLKDRYGGYEVPRKLLFLTEDFTVENGMLTQTMKPKRRVVIEKYKDRIEELYA